MEQEQGEEQVAALEQEQLQEQIGGKGGRDSSYFFTLSLTPNFGTVRHGLITFSLRIYDLFYATDSSFGG